MKIVLEGILNTKIEGETKPTDWTCRMVASDGKSDKTYQHEIAGHNEDRASAVIECMVNGLQSIDPEVYSKVDLILKVQDAYPKTLLKKRINDDWYIKPQKYVKEVEIIRSICSQLHSYGFKEEKE